MHWYETAGLRAAAASADPSFPTRVPLAPRLAAASSENEPATAVVGLGDRGRVVAAIVGPRPLRVRCLGVRRCDQSRYPPAGRGAEIRRRAFGDGAAPLQAAEAALRGVRCYDVSGFTAMPSSQGRQGRGDGPVRSPGAKLAHRLRNRTYASRDTGGDPMSNLTERQIRAVRRQLISSRCGASRHQPKAHASRLKALSRAALKVFSVNDDDDGPVSEGRMGGATAPRSAEGTDRSQRKRRKHLNAVRKRLVDIVKPSGVTKASLASAGDGLETPTP